MVLDLSTKILITGGADLRGSNLCEYFVSKGFKVIYLNNFSITQACNVEASLSKYHNFVLIEDEVKNIMDDCQKAIMNVTHVIHQVALKLMPRSINDPVLTNNVNIDVFLNILLVFRDTRLKRFVYAASFSTCGDPQSLSRIEDVIEKPLFPYLILKYINYLYILIYNIFRVLIATGVQCFNLFKIRQNKGRAYSLIVSKSVLKLVRYWDSLINSNCNIYGLLLYE